MQFLNRVKTKNTTQKDRQTLEKRDYIDTNDGEKQIER